MIREERYKKGDVLITEGQRGTEAYVVHLGRVEVFRAGPPELPLAVLGPGQIFGEMALLTDDPRSASVRALERVEVGVIARDEFVGHLRDTPDVIMPLLSTLAQRIRNLNGLVEELARRSPGNRDAVRAHLGMDAPIGHQPSIHGGVQVTVEGITPRAIAALGGRPVVVRQFPFHIGRRTSSEDPFSSNELAITDGPPWWISPSHCMISRVGDRCFIIDRGSRLGTLVDGKMVGGTKQTGRLELRTGRHEVRLGGALTPFRFSFNVAAATKTGQRPRPRRS
jgi:hypothetical protein